MFDKNICLICAPDILCLIAIHENLHPLMPSRNDFFQNISTFTTYSHYLDIMALFKTICRPLEALKVVFGSILFAIYNTSFCKSGRNWNAPLSSKTVPLVHCIIDLCVFCSMVLLSLATQTTTLIPGKNSVSMQKYRLDLCLLYSNASTTFLEPSPWFFFTCSMTFTFFFNVSSFLLNLLALFVIIAIDPCGQAVYLQELYPTSKLPCSWPANL